MRKKTPEPIAALECHISTAKSGILVGGDGAQIKIEIPGSEMEAITQLVLNGQHKVLHAVFFDAKDTSS